MRPFYRFPGKMKRTEIGEPAKLRRNIACQIVLGKDQRLRDSEFGQYSQYASRKPIRGEVHSLEFREFAKLRRYRVRQLDFLKIQTRQIGETTQLEQNGSFQRIPGRYWPRRFGRLPNSRGIGPEGALPWRMSARRLERRPSSAEIPPVSALSFRSRPFRRTQSPNSAVISPSKSFQGRFSRS